MSYLELLKLASPEAVVVITALVVLAIAILARYPLRLAGAWRGVYIVTASIALYLNVFVLVVQSFEKVAALRALAPKQNEPPFLVAQVAVLVIFGVLTIMAAKKFRPA